MTQFRTRNSGQRYPINIPSKPRRSYLMKDEKKATKEYKILGFKPLSQDEAGHAEYLKSIDDLKNGFDSLNLKQVKISGIEVEGKTFYILTDDPREIRHPSEYYSNGDEEPTWVKNYKEEKEKIGELEKRLEKNNPRFHFK